MSIKDMNVNLKKCLPDNLFLLPFGLYLHSFETKFLFSFKNPEN